MLVETHAHLTFDKFDADRDEIIDRAHKAGVDKIVNIGVDLASSVRCIELAERYSGLFAAVGIHPNDANKLNDASLERLRELTRHDKVVAIGEIGLDFYWDTCPAATQEKAFRVQLRLAREVGLPVVIHNREAGEAILKVLRSETIGEKKGVFHCFSEDEHIARQVLDLGFTISFTGNLTFKKSTLPQVAKNVPLDKLLIETDCPFLSPEPKRGKRNEPANCVHIARKLAEIKEISLAALSAATTANAYRFFGFGEKEKA